MKNIFITTALILTTLMANAQKNVTLNINHKLGSADFAFGQPATNDLGQEFKITRVDYYISGIVLIHDGGMTTPVTGKYILAKGSSDVSELLGSFTVTNVEGIKFSIGVEAPTNNQDPSLQPDRSPLAFQTPSMHWGWSAGYRFVALEGNAGPEFSRKFELHGMWNENYFEQTVMAAGVGSGSDVTINLDADYTQALRGVNIASGPIAHGINGTDLTVLTNFRDYVFSPSSGTTSVTDLKQENNIKIYPNPVSGVINVDISGFKEKITGYALSDISGKVIREGIYPADNRISVSNDAAGIYFLTLYSDKTPAATRKIVVE